MPFSGRQSGSKQWHEAKDALGQDAQSVLTRSNSWAMRRVSSTPDLRKSRQLRTHGDIPLGDFRLRVKEPKLYANGIGSAKEYTVQAILSDFPRQVGGKPGFHLRSTKESKSAQTVGRGNLGTNQKAWSDSAPVSVKENLNSETAGDLQKEGFSGSPANAVCQKPAQGIFREALERRQNLTASVEAQSVPEHLTEQPHPSTGCEPKIARQNIFREALERRRTSLSSASDNSEHAGEPPNPGNVQNPEFARLDAEPISYENGQDHQGKKKKHVTVQGQDPESNHNMTEKGHHESGRDRTIKPHLTLPAPAVDEDAEGNHVMTPSTRHRTLKTHATEPAGADSWKGISDVVRAVSDLVSVQNDLKKVGMKTTELRELYRDAVLLDAPLAVAVERIAQAAEKILEVKNMLTEELRDTSPKKKTDKSDSSPKKTSTPVQSKGEVDDSLLHPSIANFKELAEDDELQRVMTDKNAVHKLEHALMVNPKDRVAAEKLRSFLRRLQVAYNEAISRRIAKKGFFKECMEVSRAGTEGFAEVYHSVWHLICQSEHNSLPLYQQTVKDVRQSLPFAIHEQLTADLVELYQHAAQAKVKYDVFLQDMCTACITSGFSVELSLPSTLKRTNRIVEKAAMRHQHSGDASNSFDIVRGMLVVFKMAHVTHILQEMAKSQSIVLVRIKERFLEAPSGGGWRDLMVNFYFRSDHNRHICEVQVAHELMLTARKGLPGHVIYGRSRNALELIEKKMGAGVARDATALANFWYSTGCSKLLRDGDEKGDSSSASSSGSSPSNSSRQSSSSRKDSDENAHITDGWLTDAPLNDWRGVSTSQTSGRVVGLDLRSKGLKGKVPDDLSALKQLEFLDLRDNPSLVKPPGVPVDLAGEMHYSDLQGVQAFLEHIAKTEAEQQAIAEGKEFVRKYGPDGPALQAFFDDANGKNWYKKQGGWQGEGYPWFTDHFVNKWHGITCDKKHRVEGLNLFGVNIKHALPDAIGDFPKMEELSLKWCVGITSLPESMGKLRALRTLDLSWCQGLQELPGSICCLVGLKRLYMRGCSELSCMPSGLGAIVSLKELDLSWCAKLSSLPGGLDGLRALQILGLRGCVGLSVLPDELGSLSALGSLYLTDCAEAVRESKCVKSLSNRGCKIFLK
eukprot:gnl/MRDRNA2_/MRDRNA2_28083_c0_seq1.p1 gnl/MRDRNA2_/MRDRNA2_28083_c0~~gnl/MRDRNA2_/MRDRNA2_28083_c0_seq1.p1  ORF type:complete len:1139 (+),score=217.88 gnl/MRDRNA2_/MRDRNA2_28083_c0_seq1:112-3528(+)